MKQRNYLIMGGIVCLGLMSHAYSVDVQGSKEAGYMLAGVALGAEQANTQKLSQTDLKHEHKESQMVSQSALVPGSARSSGAKKAPAMPAYRSMRLISSHKKPPDKAQDSTAEASEHQGDSSSALTQEGQAEQQKTRSYTDRSMLRGGNLLNNKVQIKSKPKKEFIEGYKMHHDGKEASYVYGEVSRDKKGQMRGYVYDKRGKPTYVYGQLNTPEAAGAGRSANSSEDNGGIYLQDKQHEGYMMNQD